jgi:hypothetical protein
MGSQVASGKLFTVNNTLTLAGTDGTTMTFPATTGTVATLGQAQTLASTTLAQLIISTLTSSASTLTLNNSDSTYVYTGTTTATWTLPAVSGNTGMQLFLYNRGSATVTVQRAGTDNLYDGTLGSVTSVTMAAGTSLQLYDDGTFWLVVVASTGTSGGATPLTGSTTAATTVTLSATNEYLTYTGSSASTWTLPAVSGNTGAWMMLSNRGTGTITLASNSGSQIYSGTTGAIASGPLPPGGSVTLVNDGTYWVIIQITAARKQIATIGNGSATSITVNHTLATSSIVWSLQLVTAPPAGQSIFVDADVTAITTSSITFQFQTAPALNSINVTIVG